MENILILIAQLCILGSNTILPSSLANNKLNQHAPRYTHWITLNNIYKHFCKYYIQFDTLSHLQCEYHRLVIIQYAITTLTYAIVAKTHHRPR